MPSNTNAFSQILLKIIKEQEMIIGPLAWNEAKKVTGLKVINPETGEVALEGDARQIIDGLVARYDRLFGRASHEVSREAVAPLLADLAPSEVPVSLQA
ncbi:MAG: hypothetical protein Q8R40_00130 [bacterium]|nr:hypothetical protein [bacterium]